MSNIIQIRNKGTLTLPIELRRKYNLAKGDVLTLIDLGDGAFMLTSRQTQVNRLGDQVAETLKQADLSLEDMLSVLDEERERYYQERYAQS
ncbi:MAG: hypothetical protein A2W35_02400 [Chloroflexi bacterium RBG_16_57_11]|nr:MAG: hypothetical protein A2W35_02400 [Chloroflexi bacterium RBG_16_57_11]